MEGLSTNAVQFLDVLRMALGSETSHWDEETLTRAFDWAAFFEKVRCRLPSKPHLVKELDSILKQKSQELGFSCGKEDIGFEFLGQASRFMESVLLQNEHLDRELYGKLLEKYGQRGYSSNSTSALTEDISGICGEASKMQILQSVLDMTEDGLTSKSVNEAQRQGVESQVEVRLVREAVGQSLKSNQTNDVISSLVNDCGNKNIVVKALLLRFESEESSQQDEVEKALIKWMLTQGDNDSTFWFDIDPQLLAACADKFPSVLKAYATFLVNRVKQHEVQRFHPYKRPQVSKIPHIEERLVSLSKKSDEAKWTCVHLLETARDTVQKARKMVHKQPVTVSQSAKGNSIWEDLIRNLR
jgi:hypothetical protein